MNGLTIINFNGVDAIDSRLVAESIGKPHNDLMKDIRRYCEYLGEGKISLTDFFIESTYTTSQNKTMPCYLCTRKGCEMIANKLTGAKGTVFTALYINAFHSMEKQLAQQPKDSYMIDDPIERAKRWIEEEERRKALEQKIEQDKPLVTFATQISNIDGLIDVQQFAKLMKDENISIGRNKMFEWLRENKYLMSDVMHMNEPYQKYIKQGLFAVKEGFYKLPDGSKEPYLKTYITGKGQLHFTKKLKEAFGERK